MSLTAVLSRRKQDKSDLDWWLVSDDAAKQLLADETLARMGPHTATTYFIQTIKNEEKRRQKVGCGYFAIGFATLLSVEVLLAVSHHFVNLGGMGGCFINLIHLARPTPLHKASISRLAEHTDPCALPSLVEALAAPQPIEPVIAARGIARILPLLDSDSAGVLTKKQWKALIARVNPRWKGKLSAEEHGELARAILLACGRLSMGDALPQVKKLARDKATTPEAIGLQQTARNYVPLLEQAAAAQKLVVRR